ncbi:MAG: hypothetical protein IKO27_06155 [Ruminococcus sp.]|nr:hypothetical protein [Ruminococcus sp.]
MAFRKKKEESTNDKIIRLYQEGKSVDDIVGEVAMRADVVTGVIQRKLGPNAVPDAVVPHEKNQAAEIINAANNTEPAPEAPAPVSQPDAGLEGMSKLERYMFEKKKKMESTQETPAPAPANAMDGISLTDPAPAPEPAPVPDPVPEPAAEPISLADIPADPEPAVHRVSLVDDYKMRTSKENVPASKSEMEGISLVPADVPEAPHIPSYTIPSPGEEYAEMDALVPPDVEAADISDAPILSYSGEKKTEEEADAPAEDATAAAAAAEADKTSKAADKMKAFAMSQIEANNAKIAELETQKDSLTLDFTSKVDEAANALNLSQANYEMVEQKLTEAYAATEQAREEHRTSISQIEDEYRRKLEEVDEWYRSATFEANNKFDEFDERNRKVIEELDAEKNAAHADLSAKKSAAADVKIQLDAESDKITAQIKALQDENAGYQAFLG